MGKERARSARHEAALPLTRRQKRSRRTAGAQVSAPRVEALHVENAPAELQAPVSPANSAQQTPLAGAAAETKTTEHAAAREGAQETPQAQRQPQPNEEIADSPEQSQSRKHPTLAVMAALASRVPDAIAPEPDGERDAHEGAIQAPRAPGHALPETRHYPEIGIPAAQAQPVQARETRPVSSMPSMQSPGRAASAYTPLPEADLLTPVAGLHAAIAAAAALIEAGLLIAGNRAALWPLILTVIAGAGAALAYVSLQRHDGRAIASWLLLGSQLGILAWLALAFGPHAAMLLLVPALFLFAARVSGPTAATLLALGALILYLADLIASITGLLPSGIPLGTAGSAIFDGLLAVLGVGLFIPLALAAHYAAERARLVARARKLEAQQLSARLTDLYEEVEGSSAALHDALCTAIQGRDIHYVFANEPLGLLAEAVNDASERLLALQRDREEHLRLEGALRNMIRAAERAWLGLSWTWPEASGTQLDELLALLRTPRPQSYDAYDPSGTTPSTPVLIPIPSLLVHSDEHLRAPISGTGSANPHGPGSQRLAGESIPAPSSSLPDWKSWDSWPDWSASDGL